MALGLAGVRSACVSLWQAVVLAAALVVLLTAVARAADPAQLVATSESGYGRMVLSFTGRLDLPAYKLKYENGVLAINFDAPVQITLPDVGQVLPDYVTVARTDPDSRGIRIGLRAAVNVNKLEAGERLFIDLLPPGWQGLPPALPPEVVSELADRSKKAAERAAQEQRAELARVLNPTATVRVGINPTFLRIQFTWSQDTKAQFTTREGSARLSFDWPVAIDLHEVQTAAPVEVMGATNTVGPASTDIAFKLGKGVVPRFYQNDARSFVLDIDIAPEEGMKAALSAEDAARLARSRRDEATVSAAQQRELRLGMDGGEHAHAADDGEHGYPVSTGAVLPVVSSTGSTVRVTFPFDADTPAAVFRRADTVWMIFDTQQEITAPPPSDALSSIATGLEIVPAGDTKIVRLDLSSERLATLGSEGRSWVLSLGDQVLGATEPMTLERERDSNGLYEIRVDAARPGQVHMFRDPLVGDTLRVVTVMPPARGLARDLDYVDFDALRSSHGLVIKPLNDTVGVDIDGDTVLVTAQGGLTLSDSMGTAAVDAGTAPQFRESYIDLGIWREDNPTQFERRRQDLETRAAEAEARQRDVARLDLATLLVANELGFEAIGVLRAMSGSLTKDDLRKKVNLTLAIADVVAHRPADALAILNAGTFPNESDALMWRTIARQEAGDYKGARNDALVAEGIVASYPDWIKRKFEFSALRAAVESNDAAMALRVLAQIDFAKLSPEQISQYLLMQGRIAEIENKPQDALDTYGQVIAADFRPTRAEAVYRTLSLLQKSGKIDLAKATQTLAAEAMMWRGGALEADMNRLLAELYFKNGDYREGFATTEQAAARFPDNKSVASLAGEAARQFEDLYLNGGADKLSDLEALSLYYDYRQMTPPGTRGDAMIRNLARRLLKVDLLAQAGDLLQYQVDNRLRGAARAEVGADVALIRIAERKPDLALKALSATRLADLPPALDRQRRVLEARAMIDAGRQELALELIAGLKGRDADLLRVEGYWKSKNYGAAADLLETINNLDASGRQMTEAQRQGVVRAAVGYVLTSDKIAQSRLRSKFSEQMANSAEWPIFNYLTGTVDLQSPEFRRIAGQVAGYDSLDSFLSSYKQLYASGDTLSPDKATPASG